MRIVVVFIILIFVSTAYAQSKLEHRDVFETRQIIRHEDLAEMPSAVNTDHDGRYLQRKIPETAQPSTPEANNAVIWLDSTTNDLMIIFDDGDTAILASY